MMMMKGFATPEAGLGWLTDSPSDASRFAEFYGGGGGPVIKSGGPSVYPVMYQGYPRKIDAGGEIYDPEMMADMLGTLQGRDVLIKNIANFEGSAPTNSLAFTDPSSVRSRFAAFDPKRFGEADLLASWLLPLMAGGGLLGGYFAQPQAD